MTLSQQTIKTMKGLAEILRPHTWSHILAEYQADILNLLEVTSLTVKIDIKTRLGTIQALLDALYQKIPEETHPNARHSVQRLKEAFSCFEKQVPPGCCIGWVRAWAGNIESWKGPYCTLENIVQWQNEGLHFLSYRDQMRYSMTRMKLMPQKLSTLFMYHQRAQQQPSIDATALAQQIAALQMNQVYMIAMIGSNDAHAIGVRMLSDGLCSVYDHNLGTQHQEYLHSELCDVLLHKIRCYAELGLRFTECTFHPIPNMKPLGTLLFI